jgi:hypothetical protein
MRWVVGDRAITSSAASASQMGRFETKRLSRPENLAALADLPGQWIDKGSRHDNPPNPPNHRSKCGAVHLFRNTLHLRYGPLDCEAPLAQHHNCHPDHDADLAQHLRHYPTRNGEYPVMSMKRSGFTFPRRVIEGVTMTLIWFAGMAVLMGFFWGLT